MNVALLWALGATAAVLLLVLGLVVAVLVGRHRLRRELADSRAELEQLRARVETLAGAPGYDRTGAPGTDHTDSRTDRTDRIGGRAVVPEREYVISTAGTSGDAGPSHASGPAEDDEAYLAQVSNRVVLSATLGEPLVKVAAFGYAVRRALSAENRNRIGFEMRREVKRARKQRRRQLREARRQVQGAQRSTLGEEDAA